MLSILRISDILYVHFIVGDTFVDFVALLLDQAPLLKSAPVWFSSYQVWEVSLFCFCLLPYGQDALSLSSLGCFGFVSEVS